MIKNSPRASGDAGPYADKLRNLHLEAWMTKQFSIDPVRSAVLILDYQSAIVSIYAGGQQEELLSRAAGVLAQARSCGLAVIYVQVGFRPNLPEISPRNLLLSAIKSSPRHQQLFQGADGAIHSAVAPEGDDIIITKRRVNAFVGTDLEMILRAKEIDTLIMFGIATSGVVLSTLLQAADADYRLFVIKDCCADLDQELSNCLVDKLFVRQAIVITASEFIDALGPRLKDSEGIERSESGE
jgi:nicotinamidase-related amidase